jgi:hypothetical protein
LGSVLIHNRSDEEMHEEFWNPGSQTDRYSLHDRRRKCYRSSLPSNGDVKH